jgi:D-serine deaminase-like pyridoxal phosphate-dependent protein
MKECCTLEGLGTPAAVVDLDRLERNLTWMGERARKLGVRLRPHVKTHKCVEIGRMQTRGHFGGITVSTFAEASAFASAGFRDITWALPLPLSRMNDAASLARRVDRLNLLVDHPTTVDALSRHAEHEGIEFDVMVKIDCGNHRCGVNPRSDHAMDLVRRLASAPGLRFRGLLAHAGHAYDCATRQQVQSVARMERDETVAFAHRLRRAGIPVETVSVGSTPTMAVVDDLDGVTEIRPGNYVFFDLFQATLGSCSREHIALFVLATVLGVYPDRNTFVIDAGALALSKDPGARHIDRDSGYGVVEVPDAEGCRVISLSQEHAVVEGLDRAGVVPGSTVRVLPNHSCLTAAMFDRVEVLRGDRRVDRWHLTRGWNDWK